VPKDATPPTGNFHDDFSAYPAGSEYPQGTTFGQWNVVQSGYGHVKIVDNGGGNNALELKPKAQSGQTATSSTEVIGPQHGDEFTFSGTISTPEQLRQGATPNAWETAWLVWNYTDNDHFYYFVPRANGWELGKRDPAYAGGQRFLATGSEGWPLADSKQFTISKQGGTIEVKINGKVIATVTDDDQPYNGNGRIGIYSEDARVLADDIDLSGKATIEGTANHLGHITLKPNGNTFTAEVHDEDGIAAGTITYQWYSAGQPIAGATGQSYTLKDGDKEVTVRANYTDNSGRGESVLSPVAAGDNHPGSVALDGEAKVGATLTAAARRAPASSASARPTSRSTACVSAPSKPSQAPSAPSPCPSFPGTLPPTSVHRSASSAALNGPSSRRRSAIASASARTRLPGARCWSSASTWARTSSSSRSAMPPSPSRASSALGSRESSWARRSAWGRSSW